MPSVIIHAKLTQLLYCWKSDCTNQFASPARPQSHLNNYTTIRAVSSSVTTQTSTISRLGYAREGVRAKKRDSSRGHDSLGSMFQSRLSESLITDSDTLVPDEAPMDIPMTRFESPTATILSNEIELIRSGHGRRRG